MITAVPNIDLCAYIGVYIFIEIICRGSTHYLLLQLLYIFLVFVHAGLPVSTQVMVAWKPAKRYFFNCHDLIFAKLFIE